VPGIPEQSQINAQGSPGHPFALIIHQFLQGLMRSCKNWPNGKYQRPSTDSG
jgi:hypothetical protein